MTVRAVRASLSINGTPQSGVVSARLSSRAELMANQSDGGVYEREPAVAGLGRSLAIEFVNASTVNALSEGTSYTVAVTFHNGLGAGGNKTASGTAKLVSKSPTSRGSSSATFEFESSNGTTNPIVWS